MKKKKERGVADTVGHPPDPTSRPRGDVLGLVTR